MTERGFISSRSTAVKTRHIHSQCEQKKGPSKGALGLIVRVLSIAVGDPHSDSDVREDRDERHVRYDQKSPVLELLHIHP